MNKQTFAIGCLSLSAVVLVVGVFVVAALETQRALASDMISSAGTYTLLTGALSETNDLIYLIDTQTEKLVVYRLNETRRTLQRTDVLALDDAPSDKKKRKRLKP